MKILFVLKQRFYSQEPTVDLKNSSYGLINSSKQIANYLEKLGHECKLVQVVDGNSVDKELYNFKPQLVIIEALWLTGDKLKELMEIKRYKDIKWIIRVHSDIGFLAAETMAIKYINDYLELNKDNLFVSMNNDLFNDSISEAMKTEFFYLPNVITIDDTKIDTKKQLKNHIDVACFGSLRILKNQCYQALCAMEMAERLNKKLKFHITVDLGMTEGNSRFPVLKNLEELFKNSQHELVKHAWLENDKFQLLIKEMDLGLQLSYTESFNIVAADFVNANIPIIVSNAIKWMPDMLKTSTTNYEKTIKKMIKIYKWRKCWLLLKYQKIKLKKYNEQAKLEWYKFMRII
jgi:hypothetical protein